MRATEHAVFCRMRSVKTQLESEFAQCNGPYDILLHIQSGFFGYPCNAMGTDFCCGDPDYHYWQDKFHETDHFSMTAQALGPLGIPSSRVSVLLGSNQRRVTG